MSRPLAFFALLAVPACVPARSAMFGPVGDDVERRVGVRPAWRSGSPDGRVQAVVGALLAKPLDRDAVVRIALAHSARLQASFQRLGIAAAAIADATVLEPTEVDVQYKRDLDGDGSEIELDVVQDVLGLLQLGQRRGIANAELRGTRARVVAETVALVARAETAFYDVVAAEQTLELWQTAFDASAAAAEISERQRGAGNIHALDLSRQQDVREVARLELGRAQVDVELRREALNEVLGLTGDATRWTTTARLPDLPAAAPAVDALETEAVAASLELAGLRADAEAAAGRVGVARVRTFLPELGVGVAATRREDGAWEAGPALRVGLPIFTWGAGTRARAGAELARAQAELVAVATELRAETRAARQRLLGAHAQARHVREVLLPLREQTLTQAVLQYNAMNLSTFELLQARKDQVEAGRQYIDALRRYWIATAEVAALRRGALPGRLGAGAIEEGEHR